MPEEFGKIGKEAKLALQQLIRRVLLESIPAHIINWHTLSRMVGQIGIILFHSFGEREAHCIGELTDLIRFWHFISKFFC